MQGEDEQMTGDELRAAKPGKDSTVGTIFEVDLTTVRDPLLAEASYRLVGVYCDTGSKHTLLYGQLRALFEYWTVRHIVANASGVGQGWSRLCHPDRPL